MLQEFINIGFIQTIVEGHAAWPPGNFQMTSETEEKVWKEIRKGFIDLLNGYDRPHIIVIPELSVPHGYEADLRRLSASSGAVVIGGLDFDFIGLKKNRVCNRATVIVPQNWPSLKPSKSTSHFYFGKTYYSEEEIRMFENKYALVSNPDIYLLDAERFGLIGVAICSDFFDIERFAVYKGRIHHLVIISHNKDTDSYYFLAESIARLVYCNVIICNTGEYGDSIAFSPYKDVFRRIVYRHKGQGLFSTQVVNLPVAALDKEQNSNETNLIFKGRPPGYKKHKF